MPFSHPGKPGWTRPLKHKLKPPGHNLNVAYATAQTLYLSICRPKGSKKLLTLQLCSLVAGCHCVPCNCAWETAPSSIFSQDIPPNPQKAQPTGPGLKVHLHTNSVTYGRRVHESYKIRVQDFIRRSTAQPVHTHGTWQQVHSKMEEGVSLKAPSH